MLRIDVSPGKAGSRTFEGDPVLTPTRYTPPRFGVDAKALFAREVAAPTVRPSAIACDINVRREISRFLRN
jgi:hypothetical protein